MVYISFPNFFALSYRFQDVPFLKVVGTLRVPSIDIPFSKALVNTCRCKTQKDYGTRRVPTTIKPQWTRDGLRKR